VGANIHVLMAVAKKFLNEDISAVMTSKNLISQPKTQAISMPPPPHPNMLLKFTNSQKRSHPADSPKISSIFNETTPTHPRNLRALIPLFSLSNTNHCHSRNLCVALHSKTEATIVRDKSQDLNNNSDMYNISRIWWTKC